MESSLIFYNSKLVSILKHLLEFYIFRLFILNIMFSLRKAFHNRCSEMKENDIEIYMVHKYRYLVLQLLQCFLLLICVTDNGIGVTIKAKDNELFFMLS